MFKGEIIAVGTELLLGQIANTNAQYISQKMARIGVPIYYHVTVGDNAGRIKDAINNAQKRSNLIIFTGGLGPTEDDITKDIAAEMLGKEMVLDEPSYHSIIDFFKKRQTVMTDNNKKQAMVIEGSKIFPNEQGLAVGIGIEQDGIHYVFLPGPPSEMKPMLDKYVLSWINERYKGHTFISRVMRFTGIGEAALEEKLIDLIHSQSNPTIAPLAGDGEVTIRITAHGENEEEAKSLITPVEKEIHQRLKEYHFGYSDEQIESVVLNMLKDLQLTISASESCTGGLMGSKLTEIPGSSSVYAGGIICYDNQVKHELLKVPEEVLNKQGAVSVETARILAESTLKLFHSDIAVSITGIAGPDSVENKPVGLIYMGISEKGKETIIHEMHLSGSRRNIQQRASKYAFYYLWYLLKERL